MLVHLTVKFKYDSSKVKINQVILITIIHDCKNLNLENESTVNSMTNDASIFNYSGMPTH
jgi:hypothetical protein